MGDNKSGAKILTLDCCSLLGLGNYPVDVVDTAVVHTGPAAAAEDTAGCNPVGRSPAGHNLAVAARIRRVGPAAELAGSNRTF